VRGGSQDVDDVSLRAVENYYQRSPAGPKSTTLWRGAINAKRAKTGLAISGGTRRGCFAVTGCAHVLVQGPQGSTLGEPVSMVTIPGKGMYGVKEGIKVCRTPDVGESSH